VSSKSIQAAIAATNPSVTQEVWLALAELIEGITEPADITARLVTLGVTGKRVKACECPIAVFLRAKFPGWHFSLTSRLVTVWDRWNFHYRMELPPALRVWIAQFDNGLYPEVVAQSA